MTELSESIISETMFNTHDKEEFTSSDEEEENVTFSMDESSDEDNFNDIAIDEKPNSIAPAMVIANSAINGENNSNHSPDTLEKELEERIVDKNALPLEEEKDQESSTNSSDEEGTSSCFEPPIRSLSQDTILTPPLSSATTPTVGKAQVEEEPVDEMPPVSPIQTTPTVFNQDQLAERKLSHKLSQVSFSDMNDVDLIDNDNVVSKEEEKEHYNPLKVITASISVGKKSNAAATMETVSIPTPPSKDIIYSTPDTPTSISNTSVNDSDNKPARESLDNDSIASNNSTSTTRSIFALWSPFRSSSSTTTTSTALSRRPSKQNSVPAIATSRPSATFAARQRRLSRPTSIISPLPGFQEQLLAQMEQINLANTNDPKSKVIKSLKRQSIKHSLVSQNKGNDYDWDFWAGVMCDYENLSKTSKSLVQHIRYGIPPSVRGMVWQLLAESKNEDLVDKYCDLLKLPSPYDKMIQRDLARTFPGHNYFKDSEGQGQEGLYNVVRAYSLYDDQVGYCQGLAFIVGPMLLNMPDEDAFCVLIQLMNKYGLRGHFTPEMDGLQLRLYQFDSLVREYLPHVARHLNQQGINSTMYASQWFMTLFAYKFPLNLVFRIYDVIFTEGITSIFKFAIALLKRNQTTIISLDFEHLLDFLKNGLFEEYKDDDRRFVSDACELDISLKKLSLLEKEHKALIQKELADASIIEELQKSNLAMKKQLESLEAKNNALKHDHQEVGTQLQDTLNILSTLKDEGGSLNTLVNSLKEEVDTLPEKVEAKSRDKFEGLCEENASLIRISSNLEDQLQKAESILIDMKIKYAQSENEKEELHGKLFELKRLMDF